MQKLLIANRGEIGIRIMHAAAELGIETVAVHSEDDSQSLHIPKADQAIALAGKGAAAYLDQAQILAAIQAAGADAVHPGYGFLSENADFAEAVEAAGSCFVGPTVENLRLFGDKVRARELAREIGVPLLPGSNAATSLSEAEEFLASLGEGGQIMIKAIAGGGGRGIRAVTEPADLAEAYALCRSEAAAAFGRDEVYVEQFLPRARHIEVQIVGDGSGQVSHLWERDCSLQRRHQKLVEIAPSRGLATAVRQRLLRAALSLAEATHYRNLGTFEFLVEAAGDETATIAFMEANPRLQVEHTVTEEITGIDLVKTQLRLAAGHSLDDLNLRQRDIPAPRGFAIQARINMETMTADGAVRPSGGTIAAFEPPAGPGMRVDSFAYAGYRTSPNFDSLLAKLVGHSASPDFADAVARTYRALCEFRIEGVATNLPLLQNLFRHEDFRANRIYTRFVEDHAAELVANGQDAHRRLYFENAGPAPGSRRAGAKVDDVDPLAVLDFGRTMAENGSAATDGERPHQGPDGTVAIPAPMQGTIVRTEVAVGDSLRPGQVLLVMESMKMQHSIKAETGGFVRQLAVGEGDTIYEGDALAFIEAADLGTVQLDEREAVDLDHIRPDLAELNERLSRGRDENRPEAVARRRKTKQRTARENVADLADAGSFIEYGSLVVSAQRRRRSMDDLTRNTPADGLITGIASINGDRFEGKAAQCAIFHYDYTVLAGTQGKKNHQKTDRVLRVVAKNKLPLVFFTEGGGGRPGDVDVLGVAGLHTKTFEMMSALSGLVPLVGINSGRCFAGNAALLGCCDVIIATANSSIGMGGPAMIEGGGLGVFSPEEVGPMSVQVPNGVVDIAVADEAEAVRATKKYLSYFQGPLADWDCADQRLLRQVIPENRLEVYDVRAVIDLLADSGSVLELREKFAPGMITALARLEGRPVGIVANNPTYLAGAIDAEGADKASRFMQLCDGFDIPMLMLCDTPGIMVGPETEKTAIVRRCCRMFNTGASLTIPFVTLVLRKSYGLGAQAMAGGSFSAPIFTIAWPTGEFGGMGLEGQVKLGFRKELAAVEDAGERKELFDKMVADAYEAGKAISTASYFEVDEVIDPLDSRHWIMSALRSAPPPAPRAGKKRPMIDTW